MKLLQKAQVEPSLILNENIKAKLFAHRAALRAVKESTVTTEVIEATDDENEEPRTEVIP